MCLLAGAGGGGVEGGEGAPWALGMGDNSPRRVTGAWRGRAGRGVSPAEPPALKVSAAAAESQTRAGTMAKYSVRVSTGEAIGAGTWNKIAISVVGTRGETPPLRLDHLGKEFSAGAVSAQRSGVEAEEGAGDGPLRS